LRVAIKDSAQKWLQINFIRLGAALASGMALRRPDPYGRNAPWGRICPGWSCRWGGGRAGAGAGSGRQVQKEGSLGAGSLCGCRGVVLPKGRISDPQGQTIERWPSPPPRVRRCSRVGLETHSRARVRPPTAETAEPSSGRACVRFSSPTVDRKFQVHVLGGRGGRSRVTRRFLLLDAEGAPRGRRGGDRRLPRAPTAEQGRSSRHSACLRGVRAESVWHHATDLGEASSRGAPGGFSYGDYLRTGAIRPAFSPCGGGPAGISR